MGFIKQESGLLVLTLLLGITFFLLILTSDLSSIMKGISLITILLVTGLFIRAITSMDGWSGFLMFKIKEGIKFIEFSNRVFGKKMDWISDFGLVFGFGLLSAKMFKHIDRKTLLISLLMLLLFSLIIAPYIMLIALTTMDLPKLENSDSQNFTGYAVLSLMVILFTGFVGSVILGLVSKALSILLSVIYFIFGISPAIQSTPGVSFIIPGITIPLLEGAIALFILLIVHEGGHGIESIRSRIKIKSTGFLLFGFIPVGAFVDIDEKNLKNKSEKQKLRVAAAGAASNIVITILFFIPTFILLSFLPMFYADQVVISGFSRQIEGFNVSTNTIIYSINGVAVKSLTDFRAISATIQPNSIIALETDKGIFNIKTDSNGKIGVFLSQPIQEQYRWIHSLYLILALTTVLNFFVGIINLLPVPIFDGYRILNESIKEDRTVSIISYIVLACLLINLLPWIWN